MQYYFSDFLTNLVLSAEVSYKNFDKQLEENLSLGEKLKMVFERMELSKGFEKFVRNKNLNVSMSLSLAHPNQPRNSIQKKIPNRGFLS
jgi:hypothetical protein